MMPVWLSVREGVVPRRPLLHHYIREDNRGEILKNFQSAKVEQERGELVFSTDIAELKNLIEQ